MPKPFDFGDVHLTAGEDSSGAAPEPDTPFCIAILGDFSGRASRKILNGKTVGERRAILVDRDNFDEVLAKYGPEIRLPLGEGSASLQFKELDDFLPDRIFERLEAFGKLRELRSRLQDPSTFEEAAEELGLGSGSASASVPRAAEPAAAPSVTGLATGSLLDGMIEQTESRSSGGRPRHPKDEVLDFARRVAAPYLVSAPDARQPEVLAVIDRASAGLMRAVLHNRDFQGLEAAWRAAFFLVRRVETSSQLKVFLVDVAKQELEEDLNSSPDLRKTGIYKLLVTKGVETPGADPWAVVVGNYGFGPEAGDARLLYAMTNVAKLAGAPFVAEASLELLGAAAAPGGAWAELRGRREAGYVGLALPRFLLRLPYGKETSAVESFDFEEFAGVPEHGDYLWGNPAFAVAVLLAQSFSESGWDMRAGAISDLDGLPLHVYKAHGESSVKPCAESLLTEEEVEQIMEQGVMPLISFEGQDRVKVGRFQSVADPPRALAGKWTR